MAELHKKDDAGMGSGKMGPVGMGPKGMGPKGMGPGPRGMAPKLEHPGQTLKRLMAFIMKRYAVMYILVVICIFVSVLASVQGTMFTQSLIDQYIVPMIGQASPEFGPLLKAMGKVALFYGCGIIASFIQQRLLMYVSQGSLRDLRDTMFSHMEKLPVKYFDTHAHGDIMSMYTNDIDTLRQMISQSLPQILNSLITIVSVLISMIILSVPLTIVTLIMVFIMLSCTKFAAGMSGRFFVQQQVNLGKLNGFIEETMGGQKVVKVFCHEEESIKTFDRLNEELCESANQANRYANVLGPINAQLGNVSYVICAMVGGVMALSGFAGLTIGKLASFLTFNRSFSMPINQVSQQMNAIVMALAGADRIFTLLDETEEVDEGYVNLVNIEDSAQQDDDHEHHENGAKESISNHQGDHSTDHPVNMIRETTRNSGKWAWKHTHQADGSVEYVPLKGRIIFDGVDFGYTDEKMVLHDIKLFAEPGQKIAFVGSTGAGKTTIINLINRFYDIQDGKIRYDDINVNKIRKADLRRSLGIVLQDTHLFTGTVKDNIRYGKLDAADDEVYAAARLANADAFIRHLPQGYDTVLSKDGGNLSQGQRQLLAIARAAIADPPALILDEATSSIDTRTERIVQEGMDKLMQGRTTFVIAHRLSTIINADCIMVMEQGRIIERGNHEQLIRQKGKYYQLYTGNLVTE